VRVIPTNWVKHHPNSSLNHHRAWKTKTPRDQAFAAAWAVGRITKEKSSGASRQRVRWIDSASYFYQQLLNKLTLSLQRLATADSLTQVANRRRFDEYLDNEWQRMMREAKLPLSLDFVRH
jgi:PleD family two-component response regulator